MADEPTISQGPIDDPERRRRFEAVLGAYFEALEAGQSPDRQELLARHADLAAELAEFLAEQGRFHHAVVPLRPESSEPGESPASPLAGQTDLHPGDAGMTATSPPEPGAGGPGETHAGPSAGTRDSTPPARANGDVIRLLQGTKVRSATSVTTNSPASWAAVAWGSSPWPASSASAGPSPPVTAPSVRIVDPGEVDPFNRVFSADPLVQ
jgi:hypothetical protein